MISGNNRLQTISDQAPAAPSEIGSELSALALNIERLHTVRSELSRRLQPVSRGTPPKADSTKASQAKAVICSEVASAICRASESIHIVINDVQAEIDALAV